MNIKRILIMASILVITCIGISFSQPIDKPHTFQDGEKALASEVNENFDVVYEKVNSLDSDTDSYITKPTGPATGDLLAWDGDHWIAQRPAGLYVVLNNMQPFLTINFVIALTGVYPARNAAEPFLGEIMIFGGNFAPRGWAFCNGQLLSIASNSALFSLLGTTYGGDGRTTFGLPDLRGRVPIHAGNGPGLTPRVLGQRGGTETETITR